MHPLFILICFLQLITLSNAQTSSTPEQTDRIIQYRGPIPLLRQEDWGKEIELRFELYRSPEGGSPYWEESRKVKVSKEGWVQVDLGKAEPLPDEAFLSAFRFLSIWKGEQEFPPRKQVVSVAYAVAMNESGVSAKEYVNSAIQSALAAANKSPDRDTKLDAMVEMDGYSLEKHPRAGVSWLEASKMAKKLGARLPTFEEWYGAYDGKQASKLEGMTGHYEWTIPWVYEPAIHARLNELYRGKPVACYYDELSPKNSYSFRLLQTSVIKK